MKQWLWIGLIGVGLLGLIALQMRLLWIGVRLEMQQFEQQAEAAMRQMQGDLFDDAKLENQLAHWTTEVTAVRKGIDRDSLINDLQLLLEHRLKEQFITAEFQFAVADPNVSTLHLRSQNFDASSFRFESFRFYLGNEVQRISGCECYLYLHINQLFSYLLSQLYYLLIPLIAFFIVLLIGVIFLVRNARKLQKLDFIKNDFINNLTHELKTPVFSIGLATKMLLQQPEQATIYASLIRKENNKLKNHIDKVLELASLEKGRYHLQQEAIDVQELIKEAVESFQLKVMSLQGEIVCKFRDQPIIVTLDRLHFGNAIQNLIDNAIKYNQNKPKIIIDSSCKDKEFILKIQDNGIGIAVTDQQQIFKKFYRVSSGDRHEVKGFGLGLSYVKQVIALHGGTIEVESPLANNGSLFTIRIPLGNI